jgi:hypothetical protein
MKNRRELDMEINLRDLKKAAYLTYFTSSSR